MAVYPSSRIVYPIRWLCKMNTLVTDESTFLDPAAVQKRQPFAFGVHKVFLNHDFGEDEDAFDTFRDFVADQRGQFGTFTFFFYHPLCSTEKWYRKYIGVGDGSTTSFDLPGKSLSNLSVTGGGAYDHYEGTGEDGRDTIVYSSAPAEDTVIYADFTGTLGLFMRFASDEITESIMEGLKRSYQVELIEERVA